MKKQLFLTVVLCLILQVTSFAQSIKLNNQDDPGSAMLEVSSPSKGILIPNVSLTGSTDATTIASPVTSLLVYNIATVSDVIPGYYYNSGTSGSPVWSRLSTGTTSQIGTNTTNYLSKWNGTALVSSNVFDNGTNIGIGTDNPVADLDIFGGHGDPLIPGSNGNASNGVLRIGQSSVESLDIGKKLDGTFDAWMQVGYSGSAEPLSLQPLGGNVGIGLLSPSAKLDVNGNVKVAGIISGVTDPVDAQDAATKAYVDGEITSLPTITTYAPGDFAQGGIVFWVDETGQHGLVCAKSDQNSGIRWYAGTYGNTRAKGDGLYAGKANTSIIISSQVGIGDDGSPYAAQLCNDLQITEGGTTFGDWYLPSKYELNLMYQNKARINVTALANGGSGFSSALYGYYWSSTESNNTNAWRQNFYDGTQFNYTSKSATNHSVRAVRAF